MFPNEHLVHTSAFFTLSFPHPVLYMHMPFGPYKTVEYFVDNFVHGVAYLILAMMLYAVIDKTRPASDEDKDSALVGILLYYNSSATNLSRDRIRNHLANFSENPHHCTSRWNSTAVCAGSPREKWVGATGSSVAN